MHPEPLSPWKWRAAYTLKLQGKNGPEHRDYRVAEVESSECPVSLIDRTPLADSLVQIGIDLSTAPSHAPSPLGPAHKWPGMFFDAVALMALEDRRIEAAQDEAVHRQ